MAYCRKCGTTIDDEAVICPKCGVAQNNNKTYTTNTYNGYDSGSAGWGVLGFFVPVAGLILYLIWKDTKPLSAKKAGVGALASVIAWFVLFLLEIILLAAMY